MPITLGDTSITSSTGNLGIGTIPSAWNGFKGIQTQEGSFVSNQFSPGNLQTVVASNTVFTGSGFQYIASDFASLYNQGSGNHIFSSAVSGTAGTTSTLVNRMQISQAGHVTMPNQPIVVVGGSSNSYVTTSAGAVIPHNVILAGTASGQASYSTSTYRFTAPVSGHYEITGSTIFQSLQTAEIVVHVNNTRRSIHYNVDTRGIRLSTIVYANINDFIDIRAGGQNVSSYMSNYSNPYQWVCFKLLG